MPAGIVFIWFSFKCREDWLESIFRKMYRNPVFNRTYSGRHPRCRVSIFFFFDRMHSTAQNHFAAGYFHFYAICINLGAPL